MDPRPPTSRLGRFFAELRRRHVVRVGIAYAAAGFVLLQTAEIVLPAFLPGFEADAALRIVVVGFLVLFPVVVALAWVYEITPQGIRSMESLDAEAGRQTAGRALPRVALLLFAVVTASGAGLFWFGKEAQELAEVEQALEARRAGRTTPFVQATTTDASGPIRSLAVLPLDDFGAADEDAWFAAAMHESIISQLSQLGTVRVISRTTVDAYQRQGKSVTAVGQDLGVDAVVEGSVFHGDGAVRITVQLIHAASDSHLWAQDYERELADVLALQRDVATAIAGEIEARLGTGASEAELSRTAEAELPGSTGVGDAEGEPTSETGVAIPAPPPAAPVAPEVQEAVMRGRFALRDGTAGDDEEAERQFLTALERDSTFVPALTGLAGVHLIRGLDESGSGALAQLVDARELAVRAVRRDSSSIEAREVLASTEEALAEYGARMAELATEIGTHARVVRMGGDSVMFVMAGDTTWFDRGEAPTASATEMGRMIQVAMANDEPGSGSVSDEFRSIVRLEIGGRYDAALVRARSALERFPGEPILWDAVERLTVVNGDLDSAVELREARTSQVGMASPGPGADDLARRVDDDGVAGYWAWKLDELDARETAGTAVSPVERAAAHSALGQVDAAMTLLEQAVNARDPRLASLRTDPVWDPLRPDDRFKALLRSLGPRGRPPTRAPRGGVR